MKVANISKRKKVKVLGAREEEDEEGLGNGRR
jgi:hypothetical protein